MKQKKFVYIATSIDGYIAGPGGELDWLEHNSQGEDYGFADFLSQIDVILMGRNTFEAVLPFTEWPYGERKVIVMSRSLERVNLPPHLHERVEISKQTPAATLKKLEDRNLNQVYVDGGRLICSFLNEGLIDEIILTRLPVLLGKGISLFGTLERRIALKHIETNAFPTGLIQSHYRVI